jgi:hypothetical protein
MQNITCAFLAALAVFEGVLSHPLDVTGTDQAHASHTLQLLEVWSSQADCKAEFTTMLLLLRAAKEASIKSSSDTILGAFDDAIDAANSHNLHLLEAIGAEMAMAHIARAHPTHRRLVDGYLVHAYRGYESWGAYAKCAKLARENPRLQLSAPIGLPPSLPSGSTIPTLSTLSNGIPSDQKSNAHSSESAGEEVPSGPGSSGSRSITSFVVRDRLTSTPREATALDVASLLAAAHSWQMEDSVERMTSSILKVLLQTTGSTYGCIAIKDERGLRLRAAGSAEALQVYILRFFSPYEFDLYSLFRVILISRFWTPQTCAQSQYLNTSNAQVRPPQLRYSQSHHYKIGFSSDVAHPTL